MRHPTEGVLRRLLDEPAGVATADREHVSTCDDCQGHLAVMAADADFTRAVLAPPGEADTDVEAAWRRLNIVPVDEQRQATISPLRRGRVRAALRRPAAAGVAVALVLAAAGTAAANDWLQIFRTEEIAPVSITTADLNAMPDLREYGDVVITGRPDIHPVADADAAEAETGLDVPEVSELPRGVSGPPRYQVGDEVSVTFTFSAARTERAAKEAGGELPPPPPGLDGARVRLVAGPGVAQIWSHRSGAPTLVVGRAVAPRAFSSSGAPFETLRTYLLSVPGLPEGVAAPLRTFNGGGDTLPLPVPVDRFTTSSAKIDGVQATVLATRDRSMAAVAWVNDGVVTVVAGAFDVEEVVSLARSLR